MMWWIISIAVGIVLTSAQKIDYRLPTNVKPLHYKISLIPLLPDASDPKTFSGTVDIRVRVLEETENITLHYSDMIIENVTVQVADTEEVFAEVERSYDDVTDFFVITATGENFMAETEYIISISYEGNHGDDMYGFYRSYYKADDGSKVWLATTQFEATSARRAFPCFDEPAMKATFEISIKKVEGKTAISNMPLNTSVIDEEWYHFETTPEMSTYLIAFVVSDFESKGDEFLKVWARKSAIEQTSYSVNIGRPTIEAIQDFLEGFNYTLSKMDEVAVPDFSAGAMENWGICTYRERLILYDETAANAQQLQSIATVVAHEFAHQWFGDLVGPEWWSYLWLNEGFATYFESFATDMVETSWRMKEQFVVRDLQSALLFDALETSHAMTRDVDSPENIRGIFDTIAYEKAGSVIRMMEHFLTTPVFKTGLNKYLTERNHNYANEDHLYAAMDEAWKELNPFIDENVTEVMHTWTEKAGYPVISITSAGDNQITLTQNRFLFTTVPSTREESLWTIPLAFTDEVNKEFNDTEPKEWMKISSLTMERPSGPNKWYLFNIQQTGFYRVNYDEENWRLLEEYLNSDSFTEIHVLNRAQLVDDALNLARASLLSYETALAITRYLVRETDYIVWYSALNAFSYLKLRLTGTKNYDFYKDYLLKLIDPIYSTLGFEDPTDDHITNLHRGLILQWACNLDHDQCVQTAQEKFRAAHAPGTTRAAIPADLQSVVYCTAVRYGGETEFQLLWEKYLTSNFATEQSLILTALGCTTNQSLIDDYLLKSIAVDGDIRRQDKASVFSAVYTNPAGVELALDFLQREYESIKGSYGTGVMSVISGIASRISTQEQLDKFEEFINSTDLGIATDSAKRGIETAKENLNWAEYHEAVIGAWLETEITGTTPTTEESSTTAESSTTDDTSPSDETTPTEPTTASEEPTTSSVMPTTSSVMPTTSSVMPTSSVKPTTETEVPTTVSEEPTTSSARIFTAKPIILLTFITNFIYFFVKY